MDPIIRNLQVILISIPFSYFFFAIPHSDAYGLYYS